MEESKFVKAKNDIFDTDDLLTETRTYDFEKNTFVVEPVFEKENAETLGSILIRLMSKKE